MTDEQKQALFTRNFEIVARHSGREGPEWNVEFQTWIPAGHDLLRILGEVLPVKIFVCQDEHGTLDWMDKDLPPFVLKRSD